MSYITSVLQPQESIRATARLHWIGYAPAILLAAAAAICLLLVQSAPSRSGQVLSWLAVALAMAALLQFLLKLWTSWTTELAVTDLRVIYKTGFIRRDTVEMNMDKVETVKIDQSVLGRLLDYGTLHVLGTGRGIEHLHAIACPIEVRNAIIAR